MLDDGLGRAVNLDESDSKWEPLKQNNASRFNWSIFLLVSWFYGGHYRLRMKLKEKGVSLDERVGIYVIGLD